MSAALLAKNRKRGPRDVDQTEDIGLVLCQRFINAAFFERTAQSIACVIHENIDAAKPLQCGTDSFVGVGWLCHIQGER